MILKKMARAEIVRALECEMSLGHERSAALVLRPDGRREAVVKAKDDGGGGILLLACEVGSPMVGMAPLFGSDVREMSAEELAEALRKSAAERVRIGFGPESGTAVGHVFGVSSAGKLEVFLFPVPEDIAEVNEEVRRICAKRCGAAAGGLQCGDCACVLECEIVKDADAIVRKERKNAEYQDR